ncbi:50S ribosomal protein L17 [Cellulosispirillum alkaliphilum]|uniref:50S ribosomal protein L17 n=1 Tax=Cellulosispirillum alkaliphilum TaxID=3039283 RepID=UPI003D6F2780
MRHLVSGRKLNRTASHRKAMLSNLAMSLLEKERVTTTQTKAKEVRRVVERLITYGKKGDLHGIRLASRSIHDKTLLKKLFDDIAPSYKERDGGYTRIIKLGDRRGDNAPMSIIELVGRGNPDPVRKGKKKGKAKASPVQKPSAASEEKAKSETSSEINQQAAEKENQ